MIDLVGALLGWLTAEVGQRAVHAGRKVVIGAAHERLLRELIDGAVKDVAQELQVASGYRLEPKEVAGLVAALGRKSKTRPGLRITSYAELRAAVAEWVVEVNSSDELMRNCLARIGVDSAALAEQLTERIVLDITNNARAGGPLVLIAETFWRADTTRQLLELDRKVHAVLMAAASEPEGSSGIPFEKDTSFIEYAYNTGKLSRVVLLADSVQTYITACEKLLSDAEKRQVRSGVARGFATFGGARWEVWIGCLSELNALSVGHALEEINPQLTIYLGTSIAQVPEVQPGDVIVATQLYEVDEVVLGYRDLLAAGATGRGVEFAKPAVEAGAAGWNIPADCRIHWGPMATARAASLGPRTPSTIARGISGTMFVSESYKNGRLGLVVSAAGKGGQGPEAVSDACADLTNALHVVAGLLGDEQFRRDTWVARRDSGQRRHAVDFATFLAADEQSPTVDGFLGSSPTLTGEIVGHRYQLVRKVGRGALGEVWEANELVFGQSAAHVAVKLQAPVGGRRGVHFAREAKVLAGLDCPNTIPYRACGLQDDGPLTGWGYIVTGLASASLKAMVDDGSLSGGETKRMVCEVAEALRGLHQLDLAHGDVKPANILRYGSRWVLGDFGLVQAIGAAEPEGTIGYMAPERFAGVVNTKGDIYSLGITLWVVLTGEARPSENTLDRPTMEGVWRAFEDAPGPPDLSKWEIADPVRQLLWKMLRRDPRRRPNAEGVLELVSAIDDRMFDLDFDD